MYLQHFGLRHAPLGKESTEPWDDGALAQLAQRFNWLLQSPGLGLLTGEPGVGKTAALRSLTRALNPHRYLVLYLAETDFGRVDIYRALARALGLEPSYRRAQLWRDIKQRVHELVDTKQLTPVWIVAVWIVDEAQNLPNEFFRDLPAFLNFAFDSRDLISVWLVGHPALAHTLERTPYAALASRIQVRVHLKPVLERERFVQLILHALKSAGCQHTVLADSGMELLRQASKGLPRQAGRILCTAMLAGRAQRAQSPARRTRATSYRGTAMTRRKAARARHPHLPSRIRLPRFSDDCVVQIHDLMHHLLDCFEFRYGHQIDRFYRGLCQDRMTDSADEFSDVPF